MATSQQTPPSQPTSHEQSSGEQWDGDNMFNIYIYDYCHKRGFLNTARELLVEAKLDPNFKPPINAKQGLLFEWWSVFWVLFSAKSNGTGPEHAIVYTQFQQARQQRMQNQAPMNRYVAGPGPGPVGVPVGPPRIPGTGVIPPPSMANGMGPSSGPPPSLGFPMSAPPLNPGANGNPQPNGVAGSTTQPPSQQGTAGNSTPRPLGAIGAPPPRPPFQSPTMANHSPQNHNPGTAGPGPGPYHGAPMGMGMGPSPNLAHMNMNMGRGGMAPPNMNGMGGPGGAPSTGQPPFQPSSRAATPQGQGNGAGQPQPPGPGQNVTHPSPSMAPRHPQTPTNASFNHGNNINSMPPAMRANLQEQQMNAELNKIDSGMLAQLKSELGYGDKEIPNMTTEEKTRILQARQRAASGQVPGNRNVKPGVPPGPNNAIAGPSSSNPGNPANQNQGRGSKRNSVSPAEEHETLVKQESSPGRKRLRRSPNTNPNEQNPNPHHGNNPAPNTGNPAPGPMHGFPPGAPGQPAPNGMIRPGPQMNGFPGPGQPMTPQMAHMNPGMMNHMQGGGPGGSGMSQQMTQQLQHLQYQSKNQQYHQSMQMAHKMDPTYNNAEGQRSAPPFVGGGLVAPPGVGQGNNRPGGQKPTGMMPPPSPITNGMPKGGMQSSGGQGNKPDVSGPPDLTSSGRIDGSPHSVPPVPPNTSGSSVTGPATPGSGPPVTAPSPSQILGNNRISPPSNNNNNNPNPSRPPTAQTNPTNNNNPAVPSAPSAPVSDPLGAPFDFMQTVTSFDDFDPSLFRDDLNFERDFGAWFNQDEVSLDLK